MFVSHWRKSVWDSFMAQLDKCFTLSCHVCTIWSSFTAYWADLDILWKNVSVKLVVHNSDLILTRNKVLANCNFCKLRPASDIHGDLLLSLHLHLKLIARNHWKLNIGGERQLPFQLFWAVRFYGWMTSCLQKSQLYLLCIASEMIYAFK